MKKNKNFWLFMGTGFLAAGFLLYCLLRPLPWMPWPALFKNVPLFLHHHLPDALWTASFSSVLIFFKKGSPFPGAAFWWPLLSCSTLEVLQALMIWPGTADTTDILAAAGGTAMVYIILKATENEEKYFA